MTNQTAARIAALNDALRQHGRVVITRGLAALGPDKVARVVAAVAAFSSFDGNNDLHGERDCAILEVDGERVLFKIDAYDRSLTYGSPNPADPAVTVRVMTVMLADDY